MRSLLNTLEVKASETSLPPPSRLTRARCLMVSRMARKPSGYLVTLRKALFRRDVSAEVLLEEWSYAFSFA